MPSSMPAGIFTPSSFSARVRPSPRQFLHGLLLICPSPWQRGQGRATVRMPWLMRTSPRPPQVSQVVLRVPTSAPVPMQDAHDSRRGIWIFVSRPAAASSSVIFSSYWRSSPRAARVRRPPRPPPPRKFSKMSSKSEPKPASKPPPEPVPGAVPNRS
jgi:hypothetical protein